MIILLGSQKGGSGKSTLAVNISAELARRGKDVVLVDADRQGTAANWAQDRMEDSTLPPVHNVRQYENLREFLLDLDKRYQYVIVDVAGRDSRELRTGLTAAHVLIAPFRPSQADLDTLPMLQEVLQKAMDFNPVLTARAVLTMAPSNPVVREAEEAAGLLAEYPELTLVKTIIRDRKVYRDAMSHGKGVIEMDNPKAEEEIRSLVEEVIAV